MRRWNALPKRCEDAPHSKGAPREILALTAVCFAKLSE